jgi:tetratricopeptide (TPR) repeat protein
MTSEIPEDLASMPATAPGDHAVTLADGVDGPPPSAVRIARGQSIGRYVLVDPIGRGGMGVVFRAFDPDLDRAIALKLVPVGGGHEHERNRLLREAQAMARLAHPNVIPVFDVGVAEDVVFVAMELVDGTTLRRWCAESTRPWTETLAVFGQAGLGLAAAHRAGLIHRDFKPDNVMVGRDGRVRVLDFGLARQAQGAPSRDDETSGRMLVSGTQGSGAIRSASGPGGVASLEQTITAAGALMGTPAYMSPEQHLGAPTAAASDQFSFCVALWEALWGERPFAGETLAALSVNVLQGKLREPPAGTRVPRHVHAALVRGLHADDQARHANMEALLDALRRDPGARARRIGVAVLGAAGLVAAGVVVGARGGSDPIAVAVPPCTGLDEAMASTWNDARRDALALAFSGSGQAYAPGVWRSAAARIDAWTAAWVDARTVACRATRVTGEQSEAQMDRRMRCLDHQRAELDALLTALGQPGLGVGLEGVVDPRTIERAIDAVRALPEPASCDGDDASPERSPAVLAIVERLADVRASVALGRYPIARVLLAPLLLAAEGLGDPALRGEALGWQGEIEANAGSPDVARLARERAFAASLEADVPAAAADHATELAHLVGYGRADRAAGTTWLEIGRALVGRIGGDRARLAQLDAAEGAMLVAAGQYETALVAHGRALAYWAEQEPDGLAVARTLDDMGAAEVKLGRIDAAIADHQRAIAIRTREYGPDHPLVANSERELGVALSAAGRFEDARAPLERALAIHRAARGETNVSVATVLDDLGRVARHAGDFDRALEHHRAALAIWEAVLGDPHPDVAVSLLNIGYTLVAAGRPREAITVQARALAMFEASLGATHPYIVYAANALGSSSLAAGDPAAALRPLARALALRGRIEVDPTLFADTMFALAKARWRAPYDARSADADVGAPAISDPRALASTARDLFATDRERWSSEIADIDAWLAAPK